MSAILLVEDSPTHTALMRSLLEHESHQVRCASDGVEAVDQLQQALPDLVVTDLRMPRMNGMELVQRIANDHPQLPSVVVTARGSESLAVDALALGATNFVPKNLLHKLLARVVRHTITLAQTDAVYRSFPGQLHRPEFSFTLTNNIRAIEPAVLFVVGSIAAAGYLNPTDRVRVGTATASAIFNAICYGNLEVRDDDTMVSRLLVGDESGTTDLESRAAVAPYNERRVQLKVSIASADTRVLVSHDGPGKLTRLTPAPGTPESFELEQCRGLMLMTSFMDDVAFRSGSSQVVMVKKH